MVIILHISSLISDSFFVLEIAAACNTASQSVLCVRQKGSHSCWKISGKNSKFLPFLISLECSYNVFLNFKYS